MKVFLALMDGMRPDSLTNVPEAQALIARSASTMEGKTVFPSVTLPCHMSLFHSVDPDRHGTTTNTYVPQVRPIDGLCEVLKKAKKYSAFFNDWHELRDLARPGNVAYEYYLEGRLLDWWNTTPKLADAAIEQIQTYAPDFVFYYNALPDEMGHTHGWMGQEYMDSVAFCWKHLQRVLDALPEEYVVIVIADHGGHARTHGTAMHEDMTIPVFLCGGPFAAGTQLQDVSIKDIAPTVAALLGAEAAPEWEGKVLF